jgi:hypothetical protein
MEGWKFVNSRNPSKLPIFQPSESSETAMHYPLVMVWESGKRLANLLTPICRQAGCCLREVREVDDSLALVPLGASAVLVLEISSKEKRELAWLQHFHESRPGIDAVAVLRVRDIQLAHVCRELGAAYVVEPGRLAQELGPVVTGFIRRTWNRSGEGSVR